MDDLEISLQVRAQIEARCNAEIDPQADISLFVPWGILGPEDYKKRGLSEKLA